MASSGTGGVKAFSLQGRLYRERERLSGMTDEERAWRAKWIKDQHLSKNEPIPSPALYKELINPIRRFYRAPLDKMAEILTPMMGKNVAMGIRAVTGKVIMALIVGYSTAYYLKYNANDWTRKGGWRIITGRAAVVPGEAGYPASRERLSPSDYANRGFKNSPI